MFVEGLQLLRTRDNQAAPGPGDAYKRWPVELGLQGNAASERARSRSSQLCWQSVASCPLCILHMYTRVYLATRTPTSPQCNASPARKRLTLTHARPKSPVGMELRANILPMDFIDMQSKSFKDPKDFKDFNDILGFLGFQGFQGFQGFWRISRILRFCRISRHSEISRISRISRMSRILRI